MMSYCSNHFETSKKVEIDEIHLVRLMYLICITNRTLISFLGWPVVRLKVSGSYCLACAVSRSPI